MTDYFADSYLGQGDKERGHEVAIVFPRQSEEEGKWIGPCFSTGAIEKAFNEAVGDAEEVISNTITGETYGGILLAYKKLLWKHFGSRLGIK